MLAGIWWFSGNGSGNCAPANAYQSLGAFNTECYSGNAMVAGLDIFMGFAGAGTFHAAFDNVQYAFDGQGTTFNFEPDSRDGVVPEPATMTLLATGLAGMAAGARQRKRSTKA